MSPPQSFRSFREADVQHWVACSSVSCVSNFKLWHQPRGCLILHNPHNSPDTGGPHEGHPVFDFRVASHRP